MKRHRVKSPTVTGWMGGKYMPTADKVRVMAADLGVRFDWLYFGEGPMRDDGNAVGESAELTIDSDDPVAPAGAFSDSETMPGYVRFQLLDLTAGAGSGAFNDGYPEVMREVDLAAWWCQQHLPRPYSRVRLLTCKGDSMKGEIEDGEVLFVDTQRAHFDGAGIYVLNWHGRGLVKRLVPRPTEGRLELRSANPAYPPEFVSVSELDQLNITGRVVASLSLRRW